MKAFSDLSDELLIYALSRTPWVSHANIRATCRRFFKLLQGRQFRSQRHACGHAESALVVVGGEHRSYRGEGWAGEAVDSCWMLAPDGIWRSIAPVPYPARLNACTAVLNGEVWALAGAVDTGGEFSTDRVEAFNPQTNTWRKFPSHAPDQILCRRPYQSSSVANRVHHHDLLQ
jgi:hypothetical protein